MIQTSDDHRFLENYPEDGEMFEMNMDFFKSLVDLTPEQAAAMAPLPGGSASWAG